MNSDFILAFVIVAIAVIIVLVMLRHQSRKNQTTSTGRGIASSFTIHRNPTAERMYKANPARAKLLIQRHGHRLKRNDDPGDLLMWILLYEMFYDNDIYMNEFAEDGFDAVLNDTEQGLVDVFEEPYETATTTDVPLEEAYVPEPSYTPEPETRRDPTPSYGGDSYDSGSSYDGGGSDSGSSSFD